MPRSAVRGRKWASSSMRPPSGQNCSLHGLEVVAILARVSLSQDARADGELKPKRRLSIEFCFYAPKQASVRFQGAPMPFQEARSYDAGRRRRQEK
jgi:hypothetical protein